ncbi:MAG: cytochrome C [Gallionella sp.]|nr:cytochrome C [Gallionella sp.]
MKFIIASLALTAGLIIAASAQADAMPAEAKQLLCLNCHAVDHKIIGPAWRDVGKRYKNAKSFEYDGKQYPLVEGLVMKISKGSRGGAGHWGNMPMPAEDPTGAKKDKIEKMIKFILSLN